MNRSRGERERRPEGRLDQIRAPYGFVPLSPHVVLPEWSSSASQDRPFEDGIDGVFTLRIEALSPLFVRATDDDTRSFRTPDGLFAIPGSTLRGMLRNVVEIASFGKLSRINDHRYALRDLHNRHAYGDHMSQLIDGQPVPLVNAGWLVPTGDEQQPALIHPCHFAKIEYGELTKVAAALGVEGFEPGRRQSAVDKYERFERATGQGTRLHRWSTKVKIERIQRPLREVPIRSEYGRVTGPGETRVRLVFTGQPSEHVPGARQRAGGGHPKHHDFVFYGSAGAPIPVSAQQFGDFEFVHSATGQQHRLGGRVEPNAEWGFWRDRVWDAWTPGRAEHLGVPVFFLLDRGPGGEVLRAMGLAMMFRLAGRTSVAEGVQARQPRRDELDLAETLFGRVPDRRRGDSEGATALAGRLSFGLARAQGSPREEGLVTAVLGTPKASYYPNYLEQDLERGPGSPPRDGVYRTWNDEPAHATPRGWKRYRPIEGHAVIRPPPPRRGNGAVMEAARVQTRFRPLARGVRFEGEVRLHNVRLVELGALLWALDLGGHADGYHKLGLGRSLGYGTVKIRATGAEKLRRNDGQPVDAAECVAAFEAWMEHQRRDLPGGWKGSAQMTELLALSRQMPADAARHMQINHPDHGNEFQQAKSNCLVLRPAGEHVPMVAPPMEVPAVAASSARQEKSQSAVVELPALPKNGDRLRVRLLKLSKKEKWQAELVDGRGKGTFVQGQAPTDAQVGQEVEATVVRAPGRTTIELRWG